jgi:hypothetical protein
MCYIGTISVRQVSGDLYCEISRLPVVPFTVTVRGLRLGGAVRSRMRPMRELSGIVGQVTR